MQIKDINFTEIISHVYEETKIYNVKPVVCVRYESVKNMQLLLVIKQLNFV